MKRFAIAAIAFSATTSAKAATCELGEVNDSSAMGQGRMTIIVYSDAETPNMLAAIAKDAAAEAIDRTGYDYVDVFLQSTNDPMDQYNPYAMSGPAVARYAPDPDVIEFADQRWSIEVATDDPYLLDDAEPFYQHDRRIETDEAESIGRVDACIFPDLRTRLRE